MPQSSTDGTGAAVMVQNLVIRYGELIAVDDVSFSANSSEITVVLGPNGAGKTSTIEHLEGFRPAAGGTARVLGLDPITDHQRLSSKVGIMLQQGGIPTAIRPYELLRQYSGFFADPLDAEELLAMVGLADRRGTPYRRLSGGEQQRLSLALALIGRPEVVFLDEPTAGVDLSGRDLIRSVVLDLKDRGVCVVITTHDLADAESLADRVVIFDHGQIVADGSPSELVSKESSDELLFATAVGLDVERMSSEIGAVVSVVAPGEYKVAADPDPGLVARVTSWLATENLQLLDLRADRQRLDDVFRRLTAAGQDEPTSNKRRR
ncbi:MAG: ABC transporter ATP-binding protein [Microthrixaceae bacterium]